MSSFREESQTESTKKLVLTFVMHQIIGTVGVAFLAGLLTGLTFDVLGWLGFPFPASYMYWVLVGTPYFPAQTSTSMVSGWILSRWLKHRAMLWVWLLPSLLLLYALIALPTYTSQMAIGNRFSHFFGWSCRPQEGCFDQVGTTALFYVATAYSLGALLGRNTKGLRSTQRVS